MALLDFLCFVLFSFGEEGAVRVGLRSPKIVLLKPLVQGLLLTHVGQGAEPQGDGSLAEGGEGI